MLRKGAIFGVLALAGLALIVGRSTAAGSKNPIAVKLPKHVWGHFQEADIRDVDAKWGKGPGQIGLVHAEAGPTGGSSFDVGAASSVSSTSTTAASSCSTRARSRARFRWR